MGFLNKLKGKVSGKGEGKKKKATDKKSVEERYGISESSFHNNPLYEADTTEDHYGVEPAAEQVAEPAVEPAVPAGNILNNIGGLPDIGSIEIMTGGLKLDKIKKHKDFYKAIEALKAYQDIMRAPRSTTVNNEAAMRRKGRYNAQTAEIHIDKDAIAEAGKKMADFVHYARHAVDGANGLFSSRSSNVQKLAPVFANLLVKAGDLLPRLAHLESAVAPYIIQTDHEQYTFSDIINHEVMGGHAGGLVMSGLEDSNGTVSLSPEQIKSAAKAIRDEEDIDVLMNLRREQTEKNRMGLPIPVLPLGALSEEKEKAAGGMQIQALNEKAGKIADRYIAELRPLMTAIDDVAESHEFSQMSERKGVQDQKARSFRISRLLYRVMNNKELLKSLIIQGRLQPDAAKPQGYEDMMQLYAMGGKSLSEAMALVNAEAMNTEHFARLTDTEGKDLEVSKDYIVGGGAASISILDFKNRRVLRAPKNDGKYTSMEEQQTALNGIRDEAAGKISQFLGFQVCAQAEAVGFKARDKNGENEEAVFGGSIMEMADGVNAERLNLLLQPEDESKIIQKRRNDKYQNVNLLQNGRLVEDIMKMNALDFLIQHNDRNMNNFLVNLNADKKGSTVTAIDNDMILGYDNQVRIGGTNSEEALLAIKERAKLDFGSKLEAVFPMMTQDMKAKLEALDTDAFNQLLMPYADRLTRMTAVYRAKELKAWAKKVPTCDLSTPKGVQEYFDAAKKGTMVHWIRQMNAKTIGAGRRDIPNILMYMFVGTYSKFEFGSPEMVIKLLKILNFTKEEAEKIILENCSSTDTSDQLMTREELAKTELGKLLESYDSMTA